MDKKQKRALLIESQQKIADEIKQELVSQGFEVSVSTTVERGILRAKAYRFDLFVVNCGQEGKDGFFFTVLLKKETDYPSMPFIFTLNPRTKVDVRFRKFMQPFDILRLPFDANEFKIRIDKLLNTNFNAPIADNEPELSGTNSNKLLGNYKVLLVEDNLLNQKVLGMFISKLGLEYDVASNGQAAVDLCKENAYPFILMDIYMPGMDGTEATVKIREAEEISGHRAKIIAITANESEESVKRCYDSGMDDYLVKPFTLDILKDKLL
jgi:DNA-binding response OmpR family regulator